MIFTFAGRRGDRTQGTADNFERRTSRAPVGDSAGKEVNTWWQTAVFGPNRRCHLTIHEIHFLMRFSLWLAFGLCLASLFSGCPTTQEVWTKVNSLAAVVFRNLSVGAYRATPQQIRLADQRATAAYKRFSPQEKTTFKESGNRYLAVRTRSHSRTDGRNSQEYAKTKLLIRQAH